MGEDANEALIIRRFSAEVSLSLLSDEEDRLQWSSTPIGLNPTFGSSLHRASPNSHIIASQIRVGQFNHDAANILVREEVVARELHLIEIALCVEKERIAAPTKEKMVVACFGYQRSPPDRDRCALDEDFAVVARANSSPPLGTTNCSSLSAILRSGELNAVTDVGNCVAVGINFDFI